MRRSILIATMLVVLALVLVGGPSVFFSPDTSQVAPERQYDPKEELVTLENSDSRIWPYLSASTTHEKRSPINVFVRGNASEVVRLLTEEGVGDWEEIDNETAEAAPGTFAVVEDERLRPTERVWGETTGATRYAWVDPGSDDPYWTTETMQLHVGDYYGHRTHIRLYESPTPADEWVAMQAHTEHFDWFTLRHRVDGVENAQLGIERELMALPSVDPREDVRRVNLDNSGPSDADGWATLVTLTLLSGLTGVGFVGGRALRRRLESHLVTADRERLDTLSSRVSRFHLLLAVSIPVLYLGVRTSGIALERYVDVLSMHAIAALLYPVIGLGLPAVAFLISRRIQRRIDAALVASSALVVAIWVDYGLLGVSSLPIDVVGQRILVVVALGLVASGGTRNARDGPGPNGLSFAGLVLWVVVLTGTLFGYL